MKFRVWDKAKEEMLYNNFMIRSGFDNQGAEPLEIPTIEVNTQIQKLMGDDTAEYGLIDFSNFYGLRNYKVMISTGLNDKNDKEIFQDDYIRLNGEKYLVDFTQGGFRLVSYEAIPLLEMMNKVIISKEAVVVGNIYMEDSNVLN